KTVRNECTFDFTVNPSQTVQHVWKLIKERLPPSFGQKSFSLYYNGVLLDNSHKLLDYNITSGSVLYMVTKIIVEVLTPNGKKIEINVNHPGICDEIVQELTKPKTKKRKIAEDRDSS